MEKNIKLSEDENRILLGICAEVHDKYELFSSDDYLKFLELVKKLEKTYKSDQCRECGELFEPFPNSDHICLNCES